jgi:hypothetical protein
MSGDLTYLIGNPSLLIGNELYLKLPESPKHTHVITLEDHCAIDTAHPIHRGMYLWDILLPQEQCQSSAHPVFDGKPVNGRTVVITSYQTLNSRHGPAAVKTWSMNKQKEFQGPILSVPAEFPHDEVRSHILSDMAWT